MAPAPVSTSVPLVRARDVFSIPLPELTPAHTRVVLRLLMLASRLAAGASIGIFPEGTRNRDPHRLLEGRRGLGEIVLRSGAPVVPVGVRFPAAARLGRTPHFGRLVLTPGEPHDFVAEREAAAGLPPGPARRAAAQRIVSRVMAELSRLSGKQAPAGRSAPLPVHRAACLEDLS